MLSDCPRVSASGAELAGKIYSEDSRQVCLHVHKGSRDSICSLIKEQMRHVGDVGGHRFFVVILASRVGCILRALTEDIFGRDISR